MDPDHNLAAPNPGRHGATQGTRGLSTGQLIEQMVGRSVTALNPQHVERTPGEEVLRVEQLSSPGKFRDVSFSLRAGEVLGLAPGLGPGQSRVLYRDRDGVIAVDP